MLLPTLATGSDDTSRVIADTQFTWAAVKVFTLVLNTVSCFGTCHILQSRAYSKDIQPENWTVSMDITIYPLLQCKSSSGSVGKNI